MNMKVIILSKGKMLLNIMKAVQESNCEIAGVLRYEKTCLSPFQLFLHDFFKTNHDLTFIKKYKIPEIKAKSANSEAFRDYILKTNTDLIIVGTWREKISKQTFSMPKIGTINIHPSLLPRYRGPNPYIQVIKRGEKKTGVTIHLIDENFDTGAILLQKEIDIFPNDTGKELRERIYPATRILLKEFLEKIQKEVIIPIKQNESRATYFGNIDESEKMLDFKNKTAEELYATIRALHPWLPCYITIGKRFLSVNPYKCSCISLHESYSPGEIIAKDKKTKSLTIVCKCGNALKMEDLKLWGFWIRPFTKLFINNIKLNTTTD